MAAQPQGWPWQFFEISGSILLALDHEGQVKYVNPKGAETLDRPPSEIIGSDWFENFIPAIERDAVRTVFRQVSAGAANAPDQFENAVLRPDGSERIIAWRNALARDASGRLVAILAAGEDVTEQRQREAALQESEARFRATFEHAAVGMAHVGLDWRFLRLNERLCDITGYTRSELEALTFGDITHPDDLAADLAMAEALRQGMIPHYTMEKRYIRKNGSIVWVKLTGSLVRDRQGRPDYFIAVIDDITLRKQAERLLADEDLQRMALSSAHAGAWKWDAAGNLNWMEKTFQIFGLDSAEAPPSFGAWLERCVHRDDRHFFYDALQRAADTGGSDFDIEFRSIHPNLGLRWVSSVGRVLCSENRRPASAYGIVIDITERREIQDRLHASEERLRMAMAAGDLGVWDWDLLSGAIHWSENFGDLLDVPQGNFPTTVDGFLAFVHPSDRQVVQLALERAIAGEAEYNIEFRMNRADGRIRWAASRAIVIRDDVGQPVRMIGIDRDLTAQKASAERQERLIGELDHRVRNMLMLAQSIARISIPSGSARDKLTDRLFALGNAHGLLRTAEGETADLSDLITLELSPYGADRISIHGPLLRIHAKAIQDLALAMHELTTNAAKHGALSVKVGRVVVNWSIVDQSEPKLILCWAESGGPTVSPPKRSGFGSRLLRDCILALGGDVDLSFAPEGLRARLTIPLAKVADSRTD